jgi:hypothetical protein
MEGTLAPDSPQAHEGMEATHGIRRKRAKHRTLAVDVWLERSFQGWRAATRVAGAPAACPDSEGELRLGTVHVRLDALRDVEVMSAKLRDDSCCRALGLDWEHGAS